MLLLGKYTISMVIFNSYVSHNQRVSEIRSPRISPPRRSARAAVRLIGAVPESGVPLPPRAFEATTMGATSDQWIDGKIQ